MNLGLRENDELFFSKMPQLVLLFYHLFSVIGFEPRGSKRTNDICVDLGTAEVFI